MNYNFTLKPAVPFRLADKLIHFTVVRHLKADRFHGRSMFVQLEDVLFHNRESSSECGWKRSGGETEIGGQRLARHVTR